MNEFTTAATARTDQHLAMLRWVAPERGAEDPARMERRARSYGVVYVRLAYPGFDHVDYDTERRAIKLTIGTQDRWVEAPGAITTPMDVRAHMDGQLIQLAADEEMMG